MKTLQSCDGRTVATLAFEVVVDVRALVVVVDFFGGAAGLAKVKFTAKIIVMRLVRWEKSMVASL